MPRIAQLAGSGEAAAQQRSATAAKQPAAFRRMLPWLALGIAASLTLLLLWFAIARPITVLPRIEPVADFMLVAEDGDWIGSSDLRGKITFVHFTYSRCGEECAAAQAGILAFRDWLRATGRLGEQVSLMTISFDSDHDSPAVLREYAAGIEAEPGSWRFLSGNADELKRLIGSHFGYYYQRDEGNPARFEHDQRAVLIGPQGILRAEYAADELDMRILQRDIDLLEREMASSGVGRSVYEVAHLFVCYPR